MSDAPQENALFVELVLVFQQAAWAALGKIQNPQTGKTAVDLAGAGHSIDMLEMLQEKMKGNLSEGEQGLLANALTQLRLNYVEVSSDGGKTPEKPEKEPKEGSGGPDEQK